MSSTIYRITKEASNTSFSEDEGTSNAVNTNIEQNNESNIILAILWKYGKLAACYYNMSNKILYIFKESVDMHPQFPATQSLFRELSPHHVITMGKPGDQFIDFVIDLITGNTNCNLTIGSHLRKVPEKMTLLDQKEYSYSACEYRAHTLRLHSEPQESSADERLLYLQSLANLESNNTMHTLGALVKFLEYTWRNLRTSDTDNLAFMHLQQLTLADHMYIDNTSFTALNVFNQMKHDATFKHGGQSSCREGCSLYKLLSQHCLSNLGMFKLRELLNSPVKNVDELNKRYEFMDLIVDPRNKQLATSLEESIKKIVNVSKIFGKIQHSQGNNGHWRALHKTIFAILQINEYIKPYLRKCEVFRDVSDAITDSLYMLETCIDSTLDMEAVLGRDRPVVKDGIDKDLDEAKAKYRAIKNRLVAAARTVVNHLPLQLEECTLFYVPDMGHVIGVRKWRPNCKPDELHQYGCYYLFELHDVFHYKNALCAELDTQLGDLPQEMHNHENRIIQRIAKYVVNENAHVWRPLQAIAFVDAFMSMAKVGAERRFVRPKFNTEDLIEIENGRHPLLELVDTQFVANDFCSGGPHTRMKIVTGPNASGKSIYMKQTALLVYMAHVGSYLPAQSANIAMVHSIHTRMHATESAALNMSAFTIDLLQMSNALHNAKKSSLVLMDEFGRGTASSSSKALLLGAMRKFLAAGGGLCPHVVISTHITIEDEYVASPLVSFQKMDYMRHPETQQMTFLYKIVAGKSMSFTFEMAEILGPEIMNRAKDILESFDRRENESKYNAAFFNTIVFPPFDD